MKENKILVLFTGGTIETKFDGEVKKIASPDCLLTKLYCEFEQNQAFEVVRPYTILSENSNLDYLQILVDILVDKLKNDVYLGIIISHGTDTLSYTRALVEQLKRVLNVDIPVEFVFSYSPIPKEIKSVDNNYLFDNDAKENAEITNFKSILRAWEGYQNFKLAVEKINNANKIAEETNSLPIDKKIASPKLKRDVFIIKVFPSINSEVFNLKDYKNIIIDAYHSCTAPTNFVKNIIDKVDERNIYITHNKVFTQKYSTMQEIEQYSQILGKCKVHFITSTVEEIWAKLVLGLEL